MSRIANRALAASMTVALLWAAGCKDKDQAMRLKVHAVTNQGEAVSGAVVALDGKPVGETDLTGHLVSELTLPVGSKPRLEVKKDSDTYYFAPFYETFTVAAASDEGAAVEKAFSAVLYFVPKPKPGEKPAEELEKVAAAVTPAETPAETSAPANIAVVEAPENLEPEAAPVETATVEAPPVEAVPVPATAPASAPAVAATTVVEQTPPPEAAEVAPEAVAPAALQPKVLTVRVTSGAAPVAEAEVGVGDENSVGLRSACLTNERGRCVVRFPDAPQGSVTVVVSKKGFKTATVLAPMAKSQSLVTVNLDHGHTLDIYAVTKSYNHTVGMKDVEVIVDGKRVGATDRFGRYSHFYEGKAEALMTIGLKTKGFLPETYETDFVASGPMKLVEYFAPIDPPPVRMAVVEMRAAGKLDQTSAQTLTKQLDEAVRVAAKKHVFASAAFKEYPTALYERAARKSGKTLGDLTRAGWLDTDLKSAVDAILVPTLVTGAKPSLELSVIDSQGRVLAAAREELEDFGDSASIDRAVSVIAKKIARAFPFEGAITTKEADKVAINIGYASGRGIKAGDVLDVYGAQAEKLGMSQLHRRVASITVREVADGESKCAVGKVAARATVERGDVVVLRPRKAPESGAAEIRVTGSDPKAEPIAQANIYLNDQWIGATDASGRLYLESIASGTVKVVKQGFGEYAKSASLAAGRRLDVALKREAAYLRIESKPEGLTVKVDGKVLGKTPLTAGVPVPTGFIKLELDGPSGYKPYSSVLELDQGTLDLSGARAVALEPDLLERARRLEKAGKTEEALDILDGVPKDHSDYLLARHEAGEIYLNVKAEPAKAAEAFGQVTANEAVREFTDKRFIGSHINEGIALYQTAERLAAEDPATAAAHYQKAVKVLEGVVPYLRFVPSDQYAQSAHNVDYHRALARQKLWQVSKDPAVLADAVRTWRAYLDGTARSVATDDASKAFVESAQVYLKQASASLINAKATSRQ